MYRDVLFKYVIIIIYNNIPNNILLYIILILH